MLSKKLILILGGTLLISIISGCSSSSFSSRYKKSVKKKENPQTGDVRFTSIDDKNIAESDEHQVSYSDPQNDPSYDIPPVEDFKIDKNEFVKKYKYLEKLGSALTKREKLLFEIIKFLDTRYQYGGESKDGIDCSAFTQKVFNNALQIHLPRTASEQYLIGEKVDPANFTFGDLIFFNTTTRSFPGHVGIYLGNNLFAHASQSHGVIISSLSSKYYAKRLVGGRRITHFGN